MFGPNSENSDEDLLRFISSGNEMNTNLLLLKDLVEELDKQNTLEEVVLRFIQSCFDNVHPTIPNTTLDSNKN